MMIGKLGGHLGRKGDGFPGVKKTWKGLQRLNNYTEIWLILNGTRKTPHKVCRGHTYG